MILLMSSPFKKALILAKDYLFKSKKKKYAWLFLIGSIIGVVALVGLNSVFSWWLSQFFTALTTANSTLFISCMQNFLFLSLGWIIVNAIKEYCVQNLKLNWRTSLMEKYLPLYTQGDVNYLELHRHQDQLDNPEQRLQDDTAHFVSQSVTLSLDLLHAVLSLISFTASLWIMGGSLSFNLFGVSFVIPGYMVWAAIIFSLVASLITQWIGSKLATVNQNEKVLEANMKKELITLGAEAESIALLKAESYHEKSIMGTYKQISENWSEKIDINIKLSSFNNIYGQVTVIFPYLMAVPALFAGMISFQQVAQCAYTFGQVQKSLSWFIDSYENLAKYKVHIERLSALDDALNHQGIATADKKITTDYNSPDAIHIRGLTLTTPKDSTSQLFTGLNLSFSPGENTVIQGENGLGKSTLFKVIAGTWKYGEGQVQRPRQDSIYVIPQKPVMITGTVKTLLAYPKKEGDFSIESYHEVINLVGFSESMAQKLIQNMDSDISKDWTSLSGGEQQKIEFARALLRAPTFILLDESTAAMDRGSERHIYEVLKKKSITFISIAHRDVTAHHHQQCVLSRVQESKVVESCKISVIDERAAASPRFA